MLGCSSHALSKLEALQRSGEYSKGVQTCTERTCQFSTACLPRNLGTLSPPTLVLLHVHRTHRVGMLIRDLAPRVKTRRQLIDAIANNI